MSDKLKLCCQNSISTISRTAASLNVPDSSSIQTKTEGRPIYLNDNLNQDGASVLQGALRYVSDISDTFINPICICISSSFKSKHAKPWLMREFRIQWNIKEVVHKKTNTDEYHLAKSQLDKLLKNRESQQRTREEISKPSVTLKIVLQVYHFPTMANDN